MKPVRVSVDVPNPRPEVYEFLDVLGNHEQFTDHFMVDWEPLARSAASGRRRASR